MKNEEPVIIKTLTEYEEQEIKIRKHLKKSKAKEHKKKNERILIISIVVIVLVAIAGFIIYRHYKNLNKVTMEDYELYQYFAGQRFDYTGQLSLKRNGEITKLKYKDIEIEVDSTPIYFKNIDNEMLLPTNMGFYMPRVMNRNYKLPYFSRIAIEKNDTGTSAFLVFNDKKTYLEKSFLYDGENLYIFLYETKVKIDDKEIVFSPLSYIIVNYRQDIYYYNKESDEYGIIDAHTADVIATFEGYKINLSIDGIMYDQKSRLLIKNPGQLPTYKSEK